MEIKKAYPKVVSVKATKDKRLLVTFSTGDVKTYDCKKLLKDSAFSPLKNNMLFLMARADKHGYGISWNDQIDLSESELWLHGK